MKQKRIQALSVGALLLTALLWGSAFVIIKDALSYVGPLWQLSLRLLIACIPSLFMTFLLRRKWTRQVICRSILLGAAFFAALCLQNVGQQFTTASKCGFLTTTYVAFIPMIQFLVFRIRFTGKQVFATILCLFGAALLAMEGGLAISSGDLIVLMCGFMYAVHILIADRYSDEDALLMHIGQIITAAVCALVVSLLFEPFPDLFNSHVALSVVYCGLIEIFLCFFLQIWGQKNTPAALSGILLSMESVFGAILGFIFLHEVMTPVMMAGCVLIFISAILSGSAADPK